MSRDEAIDCFVHPTQHWTSEREEADKQAISDMKKMSEIENLLEAKEVPGGLLLAIREVVKK